MFNDGAILDIFEHCHGGVVINVWFLLVGVGRRHLEVLNIIQHFVCRIDNMSNSMAGYRIDYSVANLSNELDGATQVPSTVAPPLQSGVVTRDCASSACINSHGSNN